jgi:CRP-like cAMP-binding protein
MHPMERFFVAINQFLHLSNDGKEALASILGPLELPKGRTLIHANTICENAYFIEEGLARTFYIKNGKDVTDWLAAENSFVVSIVSFLTQKPDRRSVELLEDSRLWALPYKQLEQLYKTSHEIERLGRLLVSYGLILVQQRFDDLHFATAKERYQKLLRENPSFIQRVPLSIIASYLGITQETLSRIRAKKAF